MNPLRQAAQQALEALEKTHTQPGCEQWQVERKASVALRAALEQQEQDVPETDCGNIEWADIPKEFNDWWDADRLTQTNPFREDSPAYWAWEGWQARAALTQPEQEPVAWTDRELELIDGMIEVQLRHAAQCDAIANRTMAEKQKGWDMERVALLHKIKSNPPRHEPEQEPAYSYAKQLSEAIWSKHYKDIAPHWKPLDDLIGVLTQINNMTAGLAPPRRETEQEPGVCGRCGGLVYDPVVEQQEQEPVAHTLYGKPVSVSDLSKDFTELFGFYSAPPRRETKQKPVAWMFQHEETKRMNYVSNDGCNGPGRFLVMNPRYALVCALYTHPPRRKWQSLSEDELTALGVIHSRYQEESLETGGWFDFARAIEAALKEKNHE
jgi:hypothetical protein